MLSLLSLPLLRTPLFPRLRDALEGLDRRVLDPIPAIGRLAWVVVMVLSGPKRP